MFHEELVRISVDELYHVDAIFDMYKASAYLNKTGGVINVPRDPAPRKPRSRFPGQLQEHDTTRSLLTAVWHA